MDLIIVRRGDTATFEFFRQKFAASAHVTVVWDRRVTERRLDPRISNLPPVTLDRRAGERRSGPPPTWTLGNFVIVKSATNPDATH